MVKVWVVLVFTVLPSGVVHADEEEKARIQSAAARYIQQVDARAIPYSDTVRQRLLRDCPLHCTLRQHKHVQSAGDASQAPTTGPLEVVGRVGIAGFPVWAVAGFLIHPLATFPLWFGVPFTAVALRFVKDPPRKMWISEEHYVAILNVVAELRKSFDLKPFLGRTGDAWSPDAFAIFESMLLGQIRELVSGFETDVENRHEFRIRPDANARKVLLDTYLRMWTLVALYDIEYRRFSDGRHSLQAREGSQARLEEASHAVNSCRVALMRIANDAYWNP